MGNRFCSRPVRIILVPGHYSSFFLQALKIIDHAKTEQAYFLEVGWQPQESGDSTTRHEIPELFSMHQGHEKELLTDQRTHWSEIHKTNYDQDDLHLSILSTHFSSVQFAYHPASLYRPGIRSH